MNAQARRVEVLGETVRQIREIGMGALRIADVAQGMGISPALIIYHFETKEKLLAEALQYAAERDLRKLRRIMREPGSPAQRLMAALKWYGPTRQARGWQIWVDAWPLAMRDKVLAKVLTDLQDQWVHAIGGVIDEGVAAGHFASKNSRETATRLTCLLDGLAVRMLVHKEQINNSDLHSWLVRQVSWELGVDALALEATRESQAVS